MAERPTDLMEQWKLWVDIIKTQGVNLTVWEEGFIESIESRLEAGRLLSSDQASVLERIYAERTP